MSLKAKTPAVKIKKTKWIEQSIWIKGNQFTFGHDVHNHSREHLLIPHRTTKPILFKCGRQVEKTTNLSVNILFNCYSRPHFHALYVSTSQAQTGRFSSSVLTPMLKDSPVLTAGFYKPRDMKDQVFEKHFANGAKLFMAYAFLTADRTRGISADMLCLDEIQDMLMDNIPVIEETIFHSPYKIKVYSGTPKTYGNPIEYYWAKQSTMNEWCLKCESCGHWQPLGIANIGKTGIICARHSCRRSMDPRRCQSQWVRMGRKDAPFQGFHISQLMVPWTDWKDLLLKYETYSEQKFYNEVLGESSEASGGVLRKEELMAACAADDRWNDRRMLIAKPSGRYYKVVTAGIDWGKGLGSLTVLVVAGYDGEKIDILYMKKYDPQQLPVEEIIDDMVVTCHQMGVKLVGSDWGAGFMEGQVLNQKARRRGMTCVQYYSSATLKQKAKWNSKGKFYTINRQSTMADVFNSIRQGRMFFPRWSDFQPFAADFLGIFEDYQARTRLMYYNHPAEIPDDAFHATNYAYLTARLEAAPY